MIVVEDHTGRADAESYASVIGFRAYCSTRGLDLTGKTDDQCEIALRSGFQFVNSKRYKSVPKSNDQAGEFPRVDLSDGMGRVWNVVPSRVKDAQCEAAFISFTGTLLENLDRGGRVVSESVGPISTTYAADAPAGTVYTAVEALLAPFVRDPANPRRPMPSFNDYEGTEPRFGIGLDDNTAAY